MSDLHTPTIGRRQSTIRARDFSRQTTDPLREEWTLGKMRHLIAALEGRTVAIVCDRQTGFTVIGRLERCFHGGPARGPRVLVVTEHNRTNYYLRNVGDSIVILDDHTGTKGAKWTALDTYRDEGSAAIAHVRAGITAEGGDPWAGSWEATIGEHDVTVVRRGERFAMDLWRVAVRDLATANA